MTDSVWFVTGASRGLGRSGLSAYRAAKFAVEGFSGVLAQEVAGLGITVILAEPGAMRTDWVGSSMADAQRSPDYSPTVGAMAAWLRAANGTEPIDPDTVARAFVQIAGQWAQLGRSVDFDARCGATP